VRETNEAAWKAADELINMSPTTSSRMRRRHWPGMDSVGQQRMAQLHGGRRDKLEIARTSGPVLASCVVAPVRRWSAMPRRWRRGYQGISGRRHRYLHHVGLSASRGSLSLRRAAFPAACRWSSTTQRRHIASFTPARSVKSAANDSSAALLVIPTGTRIMSLFEIVSSPRSQLSLPRADGLTQWIVPLVIMRALAGFVTGFVPARVMPAPSRCRLAFWLEVLVSGELAENIWVVLARLRRFPDRRQHRLRLRPRQRPVAAQQQAHRHHAADGAQRAASGADPAGHPVVRHRRGGQAVPGRARRVLPDLLNTLHGIRTVDPQLIEMGRIYGMSNLELFRRVIFPGALPSIFVGVRFALGIMWLTLIVPRPSRPRRASATWRCRRASSC
jgi:sulfonate transport system permease protein